MYSPRLFTQTFQFFTRIYPPYPWHFATLSRGLKDLQLEVWCRIIIIIFRGTYIGIVWTDGLWNCMVFNEKWFIYKWRRIMPESNLILWIEVLGLVGKEWYIASWWDQAGSGKNWHWALASKTYGSSCHTMDHHIVLRWIFVIRYDSYHHPTTRLQDSSLKDQVKQVRSQCPEGRLTSCTI